MSWRPILAAYAVFGLAVLTPHLLSRTSVAAFFEAHPTAPHFIVKTILLVFVITAVAVSGRGWGHFGLRRPAGARWTRTLGLGGLLGGAATAGILLTPAKGIPALEGFGFLGLVLSVWIYSSVTEELFVRGWLQSSLDPVSRPSPVVSSGLFFGSMHLSLLATGADWWTVLVIVSATTLLGLQVAHLRQRYDSLLPPIAAHIAFNVGGFITAVVVNVVTIATTGAPLQP